MDALKAKLATVKAAITPQAKYDDLANQIEDILDGIYETSLPSTVEDISFTRDVVETGAKIAALSGNVDEFSRFSIQLDSFNRNKPTLPVSETSITLKGLYLFSLIAMKQMDQFHLITEALSSEERKSKDVLFALRVSNEFAGSIGETVWKLSSELPSEIYRGFYRLLCVNYRDDIAEYLGKSFTVVSDEFAQARLVLSGADASSQLDEIAKKYGWHHDATRNKIYFTSAPVEEEEEATEAVSSAEGSPDKMKEAAVQQKFPSQRFIAHTLKRIAEFERIF